MSYTCDYRKKAFSSTDVSDPSINEANDSSVKLKKRYVTLVFLVLLNTAALTDIYCIFFTFSQLNVKWIVLCLMALFSSLGKINDLPRKQG